MSDSVTWILTADDWNAQIHVSRDGCSTLLHTVRNRIPERMVRQVEATDFTDFRIAAGLGTARPRDTHLCFAHELLWLLSEGAETGAFDCLVIMATPAMMEALNAIGAPGIRERVIAEIVMGEPIGNPVPEGGASRAHVAA
ncbi:MAG TPA: hypothetical protein VII56_11655 [Rhizomicrobium sp.]